MQKIIIILLLAGTVAGCNRPTKAELYRAEKHQRDSFALIDQQRSLIFYQAQLDSLMPVADSLISLFKYERNEKYQDHGFYVINNSKFTMHNAQLYGLRVMVRDDGRDLFVYREGKRLDEEQVNELRLKGNVAVQRAEHMQVVIRDIKELERRIERTSLEAQKYQKRLQKE